MKTLIIRETAEFKNLQGEWDQLLSKSKDNNIFLTFDWLFNWWQYFGKDYSLFIILVYAGDNELSGIMPLMQTRVYGFRQLMFISKPLSDYEGVIISEEAGNKQEIVNSMFSVLESLPEWDMLKLTRIKEDSAIYPLLGGIKNSMRVILGLHKEGAPYLEISGDWNKYCSGLKKKFSADTRRQAARLNGQGKDGFVFRKITDANTLDSYLDKLIGFHRLRRRNKSTKSIFDDPVTCNFIKVISRIFLEKSRLDLSALENSNTIAAINFGFTYKNVAYYYIPAFNDDFRQYSVGRLLLYELLRSNFDNAVNEFDFMLGEEDYKNNWNAEVKKIYFINVYPRTVKGYIAHFIFGFLNIKLKKILNKNW